MARYRQKLLVWLGTAQGSRSAPFTWGQLAALLARVIQGLFDTWEARVQVYVDDPILAAAGDRRTRARCNTIFVSTLLAQGVDVAFGPSPVRAHDGLNCPWKQRVHTLADH